MRVSRDSIPVIRPFLDDDHKHPFGTPVLHRGQSTLIALLITVGMIGPASKAISHAYRRHRSPRLLGRYARSSRLPAFITRHRESRLLGISTCLMRQHRRKAKDFVNNRHQYRGVFKRPLVGFLTIFRRKTKLVLSMNGRCGAIYGPDLCISCFPDNRGVSLSCIDRQRPLLKCGTIPLQGNTYLASAFIQKRPTLGVAHFR